MKLKKVISGGQTGADRTGLECAKELGLEVGGTAPHGYRTQAGPDYSLQDLFGLAEHPSGAYPPRTECNVKDADVTLWFGLKSPGYWCTRRFIRQHKKPFIENPTAAEFATLADLYEVWNIAGNRAESNRDVVRQVRDFFSAAAPLLKVRNAEPAEAPSTPAVYDPEGALAKKPESLAKFVSGLQLEDDDDAEGL